MPMFSAVVPLVLAVSLCEAAGQTLAWLSTIGIGFVNVMWSGMTSVLMLLIGHLFFKERLAAQEWLGVAVVLAGVAIMNWKQGH